MKLLTESIPEDRIVEIAKTYAMDPFSSSVLRQMKAELSNSDNINNNVLDLMKSLCKHSNYQFNEFDEDSRRFLVIAHNGGHKWSLFLANYWSIVLENFGLENKATPNDVAVIFELIMNPSSVMHVEKDSSKKEKSLSVA